MSGLTLESQLLSEIESLRDTVEALQATIDARPRVALRAGEASAYLGQPVTVVATVTDSRGFTQVNVPVTLAATWGRLKNLDVSTQDECGALTLRTGLDGTVKVRLSPPTSENLLRAQLDSLAVMIGALPSKAATPQAAADGLKKMVRQYLWDGDLHFRRAVDIYFRDFRPHLFESINEQDRMSSWSYFDSTVIAYVHDSDATGDKATVVLDAAALNVRFKDWLAPFLQSYDKMSDSASTLGDELTNTKQENKDTTALLPSVYERVREFMTTQRGWLGERVGQKNVEKSLQAFVASGIDDLSPDARVSLTQGLRATSATSAVAGVNVLSGLAQAGEGLQQEIQTKAEQALTESLGNFRNVVRDEAQNAVKTTQTTFGELRANAVKAHEAEVAGAVQFGINQFKNDLKQTGDVTLNTYRGELTKSRDTFTKETGDLRTKLIGEFQTEVTRLRGNTLKEAGTELGTLRTNFVSAFQNDIGKEKETRLAEFQNVLAVSKLNSLTGFQTDLTTARNNSLQGFRTEVGSVKDNTLKTFQADVGSVKDNTLKTFQADAVNVRDNTLKTLQNEVVGVRDTTLKAFQNDVVSVKDNTLKTFQTDVVKVRDGAFKGFQSDVGGVRDNTLKTFQNDVVSVRDNTLKTFQNDVVSVRDNTLKTFQSDVGRLQTTSLNDFRTNLSKESATINKDAFSFNKDRIDPGILRPRKKSEPEPEPEE